MTKTAVEKTPAHLFDILLDLLLREDMPQSTVAGQLSLLFGLPAWYPNGWAACTSSRRAQAFN